MQRPEVYVRNGLYVCHVCTFQVSTVRKECDTFEYANQQQSFLMRMIIDTYDMQ